MNDCVNAALFDKSSVGERTPSGAVTTYDDSYLRARGFDKQGNRVGGITVPRQVVVPRGAILFRTFGGDAKATGQWWFTPYELTMILDYFGRTDVSEGRQAGKGMLHAVFAVLKHEWNSTGEFFTIIELNKPFYAFYGEGDDALLGASGGQKGARILVGNSQRCVRQLMLPNFWNYESFVTTKIGQGNTDTSLVDLWKQYAARRLPFES